MKAPIVYMEKVAFIAWGGRDKTWGGKKIQVGAGYSNLLGVVPYPNIFIRFGDKDKTGVQLGTRTIGIDSHASKSFKERTRPRGLLDILIEKIEDKKSNDEKGD